jgi:hypothetical protein
VTRYRLRFLLQEVDLPHGDILIGRSAGCQITLDDPLVSRQHARLRLLPQRATIEDLSSRNGLSLNGRPISGEQELSDSDRIRIGTQEFVFCSIAEVRPGTTYASRQTGFMCHCAACGHAYPTDLVECPNCGSRDRSDEETISGFLGDEANRNWTLELLVEVLRKAINLQRWEDVERMLRRARANVDERVAAGQAIDMSQLHVLGEAASRLALARGHAEWASWLLTVFAVIGAVPPLEVCDALALLPPAERALLAEPAGKLLQSVATRGGFRPEERSNVVRLEFLHGAVRGGHG